MNNPCQTISQIIHYLERKPRAYRIGYLKSIIPLYSARSIRRLELEDYLQKQVTAQLRKENRAA